MSINRIENALNMYENLCKTLVENGYANNAAAKVDFNAIESARQELKLFSLGPNYLRPCNDFKGYEKFIESCDRKDKKYDITITPDYDTTIRVNSIIKTWNDGVPVLKYFDREDNFQDVDLASGINYRVIVDTYYEQVYLFSQGRWYNFKLYEITDFLPDELRENAS